MKVLVPLFCVFLLLSAAVRAHETGEEHTHDEEESEKEDTPSSVLKLTEENFDEKIKAAEMTLVKFYAPWCGHCKALAPEYEQAATTLAGKAVLAEVDCTVNHDLCTKYGVQGFPTVKLFRNDGGEPTDYEHERKAGAIVNFMIKQKQPAFTPVATKEEAEKFASEHEIVVLGVVGSDQPATEAFTTVAKSHRNDYDFMMATNDVVADAFGVKAPAAIMFKKFDDPRTDFTGKLEKDELVNWIVSNAFPILGTIGPENYQKYLQRGFPLVWVFVDYAKNKDALDVAKEVAKSFKTSLSFVQLDGVRWGEHAKSFGLSGKLPGVVIEDRENMKKYVFPEDQPLTVEALKAHAQGFIDKTLTPTLKSEEIPEKNDGPVKIVVGKSFDSIVMDKTKDVFVKFYAPWCGHCKALAPKWEKLGEQLKTTPGAENVIIAKVDATENDTPVDIRGFPTLIFYPANDKTGVPYEGERDQPALFKWVMEHASTVPKEAAAKAAEAAPKEEHAHEDL